MGPWAHGSWTRNDGTELGNLRFNAKTALFFREKVEFPFFEQHLKGKADVKLAKAVVFESGTNRWRNFTAWPPEGSKQQAIYLLEYGKLGDTAPKATNGFAEYLSDPAKPVPHVEKIDIQMGGEYMTADQRFASRRPDVLVFEGPELKEDVTVAGPIDVDIYVSTTGTDADFIVKLIDVFPADYPDSVPDPKGPKVIAPQVKMGSYQMMVRGEVFRGRFRNSFEKPEAFKPGEPARIRFTLPDALHTFRPGHRMMVQVQSTWFPIVDRNPQKFVDIYQAKPEDFQKATHRVYLTSEMPSKVSVRVLP